MSGLSDMGGMMARSVWICVDCGTEISEVGREIKVQTVNDYFEYCFRCVKYEPTVIISYR